MFKFKTKEDFLAVAIYNRLCDASVRWFDIHQTWALQHRGICKHVQDNKCSCLEWKAAFEVSVTSQGLPKDPNHCTVLRKVLTWIRACWDPAVFSQAILIWSSSSITIPIN